eukprot:TRINITY_DN6749_c0_g1_i1.p1 TRINITY_DN6749_c0_g1~~TRINITY_DN6749_c0_g1_i1.p1  ORF type:complete len:759 (-),score=201.95 TRINITY_DN6749_c0_g1_i1:33-2258(-)
MADLLSPVTSGGLPQSLLRTPSPAGALSHFSLKFGGGENVAPSNLSQSSHSRLKGPSSSLPAMKKVARGPATGRTSTTQRRTTSSNPSLANRTGTATSRGIARKRVATSTTSTTRRPAGTISGVRTTGTTRAVRKTATKTTGRARAGGVAPARSGVRRQTRPAQSEEDEDAPADNGRRAAWDVKGRLADLESHHQSLKGKVQDSNDEISKLQAQLAEKSQTVSVLSEQRNVIQQDVSMYQTQVQDHMRDKQDLINKMDAMRMDNSMKMSEVTSNHTRIKMELESANQRLQMELDSAKSMVEALRAEVSAQGTTIATQTLRLAAAESEREKMKLVLNTTKEESEERRLRIEELESRVAEQIEAVDQLEATVREDEMVRRKLHNDIQELKGNIRVFCRIRPLLGDEKDEVSISYPHGGTKLEMCSPDVTNLSGKTSSGKKMSFAYDKVFGPESTQGKCFDEISQLVQSALDGYRCCIFTYGQTGSGKTYTMEGPESKYLNDDTKGMIPRAVEQIFQYAKDLRELGWEYKMEAIFLEIYNENIRDLLASKQREDVSHNIKHDKRGNTNVTDITTVKVEFPQQVFDLLKRATRNRAVASTMMNERSSRSHSVFQLKIVGKNSITGENASGILNLIDLAGSERLSQSHATGDRLKETQNINKSLSCLGDVISALSNKDSHIPYRNSKLTYLLQNSLGGSAKTLMFVNCSPMTKDLNETLSSLRFATKVNACQIGSARKQAKVKMEG